MHTQKACPIEAPRFLFIFDILLFPPETLGALPSLTLMPHTAKKQET